MRRKWSARSLRNLRGIHPDLRRVLDRALQESPLDFIVIEGLRTLDRQHKLVASGASQTLDSRHLTGHAADLLPIGPDGRAAFDWPLYDRLGPAIERIAREEGVPITWGGRWTTPRDGPHFQLTWEDYPKEQPFIPQPVSRAKEVTKTASENKGNIAATLSTVGGAVASAAAAAQDAPVPVQYALAGVIVLGAAAFIWSRVRA